MTEHGAHLALFSLHGLIRGREPELGRDPDTGGQVQYVLELARALAAQDAVERVDLLTRRIADPSVDADYAEPQETLAPGCRLVRLDFGPSGEYLRKELLWPHLDECLQAAIGHFRSAGRVPDLLHSHYADAGRLGVRLSRLLGVPLVHTGHSLGRIKRERLLASGESEEEIESRYNISTRIAAEEETLAHASFVVASTRQEAEDQWGRYEQHDPEKIEVIAPGVRLDRFRPPTGVQPLQPPIRDALLDFLREPDKPMILALARPDPRKNISRLLEAYGQSNELQEIANLVLVLGTRDDLRDADPESREVLEDVLTLVDVYDLHGRVAYPKQHRPDDVPDLYRLAASTGGLFVNPALTEPFGLTLIEAAASGLPVVATSDGGPQDILAACQNGLLVDPLDEDDIASTLRRALTDRDRWRTWSANGLESVQQYSWRAHARRLVERAGPLLRRETAPWVRRVVARPKLLVTDLDGTLLGDSEALESLLRLLTRRNGSLVFGVATGRRLESAREALAEWGVPPPDILVTAVGSEIHYGPESRADELWRRQISEGWERDTVAESLGGIAGLRLQETVRQRDFKLSFYVDEDHPPAPATLRDRLRMAGLEATLILSHGEFLDVLPARASKGRAIEHLAETWGFPTGSVLVAGDSGNDADMLRAGHLGTVVGNFSPELEELQGRRGIYFAARPFAGGILEGIAHHGFA
jgi:sucrose-phosphate synthase